MRIFHMADLHIGKKLNQAGLEPDQAHMLEQVIQRILAQKPDVLVLAGDIYDRRNPSVEAVELLDAFLSKVVLDCKVPVIAISGNHDSAERLGFASSILTKAGLHIAGRMELPVPQTILYDQWGPVVFHQLSYGDLATIKYILQTEESMDYQTAMQTVLNTITLNRDNHTRHVLVAHGVVAAVHADDTDAEQTALDMPERSDSERELTIGGTEFWTSDLLTGFDYVALGHLHSCQKSGSERIRYAGSPLKYSFSEEHHRKGLLQIDMDGEGNITIEQLPLVPLYDMRTIRGNLTDLLQPEVVHGADHMDYIRAILTDYGELLEPMARLREQYPNVLLLEREQQMQAEPMAQYCHADITAAQPETLFAQFYRQVTGGDMTDAELDIVAQSFRTVREEEN